MEARIKSQVIAFFKIGGFQLRSEVANLLVEKIIDASENDRKQCIEKVYTSLQNQTLETSNIEKEHMKAAIRDCFSAGNFSDETETIFSVINAPDIPSYEYVKENQKFILKKCQRKILANASSRSKYIRNRYYTILQRILRHELFAPSVNENIKSRNDTNRKFVLKYAENLLSASSVDEVVMLGLLSKFKEGKFYLEDPSGVIPIDLNEANFHSGLYTEGAFVLAEGTFNDGLLKVSGLGFPPIEASSCSQTYFGTQNYWGGPSKTLLKYSKCLLEFERLNVGGSILFLSDCWLDDNEVMEKLRKLFIGFDDSPPIAIVLMGPFLKNKESSELRSKFAQLAEIIDSTFTLKNETSLVLVPDIEDPTSANIFPRPPLPNSIVQDLLKKNKRVILATNPCRLQYCTQQIVVCRMDLLRKLCRNTLKFPETGELADHFARTLTCQGTLAPFTGSVLPTLWDFDSAFSLYPLPDLIVVGENNSTDFQKTHGECTIVNTGSFPRSNYSFKLYMPGTKTVEDSQIPDDDAEELEEPSRPS